MSIETIYRAIVQSVVKSHNYNHFSQTIKSKFGFILDYIDKWNPELREHNCSIMTKVYQFYHNDKRFGKCHNELCTNMFYNVRTFNNGFPVCCSFSCRAEYFKTHLLGENNPNFGHKWFDDMKKVASENTKRQMQNPYYRYVANQPKTKESKLSKGRKISEAHKRLFNEHPERYKCKHHFTQEERKRIGEKSKQKFTPEYIERYRKRMESLGNWIPKEIKTDYEVYYNESNWKYRMFDLIEDKSQLDMLNQFGVFNAFTNSKGVVRDHIYSRHSGFIQRVFPEIMRHPCNCQIILHSSNVKKRGGQYIDRDDQTLEQLFQRILDYTGNWCEQEICLRKIQEYKNGKRWTNPYKTVYKSKTLLYNESMESNNITTIPESNFGECSTLPPENELVKLNSFDLMGNFLASPGSLSDIVKNKIWIISDTHFHHRRILEYEAEARPFKDRDEMDAELVKRWNERVRDTDVVIHLGDFAFASASFINDIANRLNGRKILLLGNHDRVRKFDWEHLGFDLVLKRPFLMDGRFIFSHEPLAEIPEGKVNIYGHVHGSDYFRTLENNRFCVCVERHNCAPIEYEFIKNLYNPTSPAIIEA